MNAICFGCRAIHRNVPYHVVRIHQQNNTVLRCPRQFDDGSYCNEKVVVFEKDEELFDFVLEDSDGKQFQLLAKTENKDGTGGELTYQEVTE